MASKRPTTFSMRMPEDLNLKIQAYAQEHGCTKAEAMSHFARAGIELEEGEFNTLGGWIFERLSSIPSQGARIRVPEAGLEMEVERMDGLRIDSVLVTRKAPRPDKPAAEAT